MEEVNSLQIRKEPTCRMEVINNDFPPFGVFTSVNHPQMPNRKQSSEKARGVRDVEG